MSVSVLGVCLALAASMPQGADPMVPPARTGAPHVVFVPQTAFTLAWTHSIEKTRWEEDYRVHAGPGGAPVLTLEKARIRGTGAGMEPPANAVLRHGWYEYAPANQPQGPMRLTRSRYTPDYSWCAQGRCRSLGELLPSDGGITLLWPCHGPKRRR